MAPSEDYDPRIVRQQHQQYINDYALRRNQFQADVAEDNSRGHREEIVLHHPSSISKSSRNYNNRTAISSDCIGPKTENSKKLSRILEDICSNSKLNWTAGKEIFWQTNDRRVRRTERGRARSICCAGEN